MSRESDHPAATPLGPALRLLDMFDRPGVQRVFVHDTVAVGVDSLSVSRGLSANVHAERALLLAGAGDLVVVDEGVDRDYLAFLDHLGVGPGEEGLVELPAQRGHCSARLTSLLDRLRDGAFLQGIAERLNPLRETRLSPYFASAGAFEVAAALERMTGRAVLVDGGSSEVVALSNRKDLTRKQAQKLGVPWPEGELVSWLDGSAEGFERAAQMVAAIRRQSLLTGSVLVRGVWSMQGSDNLMVAGRAVDRSRMAEWLAGRPAQQAFLVEPLLTVRASPNVQLWIEDDGGVRVLAVTAQCLSGELVHRGNRFPFESPLSGSIYASSVTMGQWLSEAGYRGPLGLDFLESTDPHTGAAVALLVEVNGRINGATYALAVTERINRGRAEGGRVSLGCWRSMTGLAAPARSFAGLVVHLGDLVFDGAGSRAGVIPYNTGMLPHGEACLLAVACEAQELEALCAAVDERMRVD